MTITSALYNLIIGPLELFFEVLFAIANRIIDNPALSIIFLSLTVNILVLPLYKQADDMQAEERATEKKLEHWVKHIKKTFKGDERFMMLQTYYRQNNYKPTYVLKGSVSLFLEIPFFIAAYNFLSNLALLNGCSFLMISDLGAPDGLIKIAGYSINLLPILMTVINLVSSAIYTKDLSTKSKIQLYGMAGVFLVLLYDSPSGLVFYWTLNNIFSLFKNIYNEMKNTRLAVGITATVVSVVMILFISFVHPLQNMKRQILVTIFLLLLNIPLLSYYFKQKFYFETVEKISKKENLTFYLGGIFMAVFCGAFIPSTVLASSPEEFINLFTLQDPIMYLVNTFIIAAGIFIVWFNIFYALAKPAGKRMMSYGLWALAGIGFVNYMFFGKNYGNLSPELKFDITPVITLQNQLKNLGIILIVAVVLFVIWKKKEDLVRVAYVACIIGLSGTCVMTSMDVHKVTQPKIAELQKDKENLVNFPVSQKGKNVMVFMLDRGFSPYIPYIFHEKPELKEQFSGFTYYPNTISYGRSTNFGLSSVFGGYEYTPEEMNKRNKISLEEKHNEALKVMPVLFDRAGFKTTVSDPTYAGYSWIPQLSIYDDYPNIKKYISKGKFDGNIKMTENSKTESLNRNFFMYSLFRISPLLTQGTVYNKGNYNANNAGFVKHIEGTNEQVIVNNDKANGVRSSFVNWQSVLDHLPTISHVDENEVNTFMMMCNETPHQPALLQRPSYTSQEHVDNSKFSNVYKDDEGHVLKLTTQDQIAHYHVNMASMIEMGQYFESLKERGVYDNTRIIIVADHGYNLYLDDKMVFKGKDSIDTMNFNPLLMVKDFNDTEFKTDSSFMTNADVPTIAMQGLISDPVNPFTNKPINSNPKYQGEQHILYSKNWNVRNNHGNVYTPGTWLSVKDNIFDRNNWKIIYKAK